MAASCFAGHGDPVARELMRLKEGRPAPFLARAALGRPPAPRARALPAVDACCDALDACGTWLGEDVASRQHGALALLAAVCRAPPPPEKGDGLTGRDRADLAALASRARERCAARGGARGALVAAQEELAAVAAGKRSAALSADGSAAAAAAEVLATLAARGGPRDARAAVGARAAAAAAAAAALAGAEALPKPWRAGAADAAAALAGAARDQTKYDFD